MRAARLKAGDTAVTWRRHRQHRGDACSHDRNRPRRASLGEGASMETGSAGRVAAILGGAVVLVVIGVMVMRGRASALPAHTRASAEAATTVAASPDQAAATSSAEARRARDAMRAQIL